ncbi:MAG: gamma-glutamyltransferase family protein, partial [Actinomycetota bacterium]|nr:gamma-glutamyltransferase family protein [Actinomycetota bacterium]
MPAGIAAGHPATAAAGVEILLDGGTAADAAVAATLASCVAETVMTGLAGGGHAICWDATEQTAQLVDFFVAVPGLGLPPRERALIGVDISFGTAVVPYEVGIASCAVPGLPAGCHSLWRGWGRLPWPRLVEPALRLARSGVPMPPAHADCLAMLAPVLTMNEGAGLYAPGGRLLEAGDRLDQPGLVRALELLADEGPDTFYRGAVAEILLEVMRQRGGLVTRADLEVY